MKWKRKRYKSDFKMMKDRKRDTSVYIVVLSKNRTNGIKKVLK